ncbi:dTDP-4-dehydrorhamnose reductase subunit,NAD(P)-binding, of dTDP-L-rhamnose synthase [Halomonas sp. R57-5]|uniref:dTDP-4-dehydrorhamnose reductase n=1 Tax=Halomonas sp. R57-5 TaxID=1610576 RepID=UPI0005FC681E|nr:dTDP-4-dehydrorhamnose reductase [Halomonas sp. R57-5]CEP36888.1 dTDP-4-dehydrorhamnose reductase subunit,NAD(P)-binding, of dTDP-L-rhamnose synthase [Halomonas sp. R57-5]
MNSEHSHLTPLISRLTILITGGNGQVGFELRRQLATLGEILAPNRAKLDLADTDAVSAYLDQHQPDLIVNAAAYTAVDNAESDQAMATRLNAEVPAQLAEYCQQRGSWLIHYSSDYVYNGEGIAPWQENDATGPCNAYGATKLAGDEAVANSGCKHLIFRTSWVYSAFGKSFLGTMLRLGAERPALSIVSDQMGAPTPARLIALVTQQALATLNNPKTANDLASGVYHLAPRGETSWHGFACEIFQVAKQAELPLAISPEGVSAIPTADYPTPAARPLNSRLAVEKLEAALGIQMPTWQSQLALTVEEIASSR